MDNSFLLRNKKLDIIRIIAAIAVVFIHVSASRLNASDINGADFVFSYLYDSMSRFGVPFFFMISGVLFLDDKRNIELKKLWLHNVMRIIVIYFLWSALFTLPNYFAQNGWNGVGDMILVFSQSSYHLWFLPVIALIYVLVPFLRTWIKNASQKELELFLVLFVIFNIVVTTIKNINLSYSLSQILKMFSFDYFPIHLCCFILGYYLYTYRVGYFKNAFLLLIIFLSYTINVMYGVIKSRSVGTIVLGLFEYDNITTFVAVCALFLLLLQLCPAKYSDTFTDKIIAELSSDSLGVYLVHLFFVGKLTAYGSVFNKITAGISIPLVALLVFLISVIVAATLRRIPVIGRYIC